MLLRSLLVGCVALMASGGANVLQGQVGPEALRNAMKALSESFGEYYWTVYPTETWGVGAILSDDDRKGHDAFKDSKYQTIRGWEFVGLAKAPVDPKDKIVLHPDLVRLNKGPGLSLSTQEVSDIALKATLPLIGGVLGLGGDFSRMKDVKLELRFASLEERSLNKPLVRARVEAIRKGQRDLLSEPYAEEIRRLLKKKRLFVVTDDILIHGMEIEVTFGSTAKGGVEAGFKGALEKHVGSGANAAVRVERKNNGQYVLRVEEPFVFARYGRNYRALK